MLEATISVNREKLLAQLHAVRTKPRGKTVKEGTICTYNVVVNNQVVDTMTGAYGCGIDLGIELLKKYRDNKTLYTAIVVMRKMEGV